MFPKKLVPDVVVNDECDIGDVCDADGENTVDEESDLDNFALNTKHDSPGNLTSG